MEIYNYAKDLPQDWDQKLGSNLYLRKEFLEFMERVDDTPKKYYIFRNKSGEIDTLFMTHFRTGYNLTMFSKIKTSIKMTFIYIPLSISRPGIIYGEETKEDVAGFLRKMKGYKIILNTEENYDLQGFTKGLTCPRCVLKIRWHTFDDYMNDLRSNYRYRYKKAFAKSKDLKMYFLEDNQEFSEELYGLYLQVYENSPYKLEKLKIDFFRDNRFKIFVLEDNSKPQGFIQLLENEKELIFEFVGFEHKNNHVYDIYIRMLLEIVRYGIEGGFETIDFGQTADEAKLKLGCKYQKLYALLNHSNPLVNWCANKISRFIQYKPLDDHKFRVFKTNEG